MTACAMLAAIPRFLSKLQFCADGHCRIWTGAQTCGGRGKGPRGGKARGKSGGGGPYGRFWVGPGKKDTVQAHVFAAWLAGKIPTPHVPKGFHLDHGCRHGPLCVDCTELVPDKVNLQRVHSRPLPKEDRLPSRLKRHKPKRGKAA